VIWRLALLALATAAALAPIPADSVERFYSEGIYPRLQPLLTATSNLAPLAFFDVLCIVVLGTWLSLFLRDALRYGRRRWPRIAGRLVLRTLVLMAGIYVAFLAVWGLNYRRVPLMEKVEFDPTAVSPESALRLALTTVEQMNALFRPPDYAGSGNFEPVDPSLAEAFRKAHQALGNHGAPVLARPKRSLLDPYFRAAGVEGMTAPFFLETLVASDLLPMERPFVEAHEWAHLSGIADEGEANFVGWLACLRGSERARYSGWLFLYGEAVGALPDRDRADLVRRLQPGPRADLQAMAERRRRNIKPMVFSAGWRVYDRYLKANRIEAGTASYGQVLRLVLGTHFSEEWTPALRTERR
jgi:hypothetical protein